MVSDDIVFQAPVIKYMSNVLLPENTRKLNEAPSTVRWQQQAFSMFKIIVESKT